jgi:two-component system NtrC family response regulator
VRVVNRVDGNLTKAAELLGVSRPTLYDLMRRYGIK